MTGVAAMSKCMCGTPDFSEDYMCDGGGADDVR